MVGLLPLSARLRHRGATDDMDSHPVTPLEVAQQHEAHGDT